MAAVLAELRPLVFLLIIALVMLALSWAQTLLIPIALAVLLTFILAPVVTALQARGLRRLWAVVLVMLATLGLLGGASVAVTMQFHDLIRALPTHKDRIATKLHDLVGTGPSAIDNLGRMVEELNADLQGPPPRTESRKEEPIRVAVEAPKATGLDMFPWLAGPAAQVLGALGLVLALTGLMLLYREDVRNRVIRLAGRHKLTSTTRAFDEATRRISRYLVVQVILNAGFGLVLGLGLLVIGVPYALLWGCLAALLRFIPYLGTWLAALFPLLMSLAVFDGWFQPLLVILFVVVSGLFANYALEPALVSRSTGVSPVALVVAAAFWTWLWGPLGLVLSTPLTVCLGVLGKHVGSLQFLDVVLGTDPALEPQYNFYQRLLAHDEGEAAELVDTFLAAHSLQQLADEVILPTLVRAKEDLQHGELTEGDLHYVLQATRGVLEEAIPLPMHEAAYDGALVVCCAAHDEVDEVALELGRRVLASPSITFEIIGSRAVSAEVVARVSEVEPAAVLIAAVPPTGAAQTRYLCKRLRARQPDLALLVGRWGQALEVPPADDPLLAAGATRVAGTMAETGRQLTVALKTHEHRYAPA